jgi:hypothetical protein
MKSSRQAVAVIDLFTIAAVSFSFGISSSLYQSPIWIKASLLERRGPFPAWRGPENLRLLAVSKTGYHRSGGC